MSYGTLAHTVGKLPLQELTERLSGYDIDFVQLALAKAIGDIDTSTGKLSPGLVHHIANAFQKKGLRIGVLGCYINPIHPDPVQRRKEIDRFKEHLRYAREFGAKIVATETASLLTYQQQDPERYVEIGWQTLKSTVEELVEEAEKWGAIVGLEPVCVDTLSSPSVMRRVLDEFPSHNLGVVFDPVNLLDQQNYTRRDELFRESFELFGDRIVLMHLRDARYAEKGRIPSTLPGRGEIDLAWLLHTMHEYKPYIDISIEGIKEQEINEAVAYLKSIRS
jgi:sugar phosphate isomerase/epimerase